METTRAAFLRVVCFKCGKLGGKCLNLFEKNGNSSEKTVKICRFFAFHRDVETVFNNVKMYDPQCLCGNLENIRIKMNFGVWKEKKLWKRIWFYV